MRDVVVIGASAGGIPATIELLSGLPPDFPAIIGIVVHRGAHSLKNWSKTLGSRTHMRVVEPEDSQQLLGGVVYVAPADKHMTFENGRAWLDQSAKQHFTRPAIDPLFTSAAFAYGARVVGVVLTGSGQDGTQGLRDISAAGGITLVQAPEEAQFAAMPENAILRDHVRAALTLDQLGTVLPLLAKGSSIESAQLC